MEAPSRSRAPCASTRATRGQPAQGRGRGEFEIRPARLPSHPRESISATTSGEKAPTVPHPTPSIDEAFDDRFNDAHRLWLDGSDDDDDDDDDDEEEHPAFGSIRRAPCRRSPTSPRCSPRPRRRPRRGATTRRHPGVVRRRGLVDDDDDDEVEDDSESGGPAEVPTRARGRDLNGKPPDAAPAPREIRKENDKASTSSARS